MTDRLKQKRYSGVSAQRLPRQWHSYLGMNSWNNNPSETQIKVGAAYILI